LQDEFEAFCLEQNMNRKLATLEQAIAAQTAAAAAHGSDAAGSSSSSAAAAAATSAPLLQAAVTAREVSRTAAMEAKRAEHARLTAAVEAAEAAVGSDLEACTALLEGLQERLEGMATRQDELEAAAASIATAAP
jgi:hypothetical protein